MVTICTGRLPTRTTLVISRRAAVRPSLGIRSAPQSQTLGHGQSRLMDFQGRICRRIPSPYAQGTVHLLGSPGYVRTGRQPEPPTRKKPPHLGIDRVCPAVVQRLTQRILQQNIRQNLDALEHGKRYELLRQYLQCINRRIRHRSAGTDRKTRHIAQQLRIRSGQTNAARSKHLVDTPA